MDPLQYFNYRRILFIDAFDSFTNNIVGLLERTLDANVVVATIHNTSLRQQLPAVLNSFDAVVVGPGPGHPLNPGDVGLIDDLWKLPDVDLIPTLGICLGFQSLGVAHGIAVKRLRRPRHGIVTKISHYNEDIFRGLGELSATNYHSLKLDFSEHTASELQPLAWDVNDDINSPILMALRHRSKPFWGLQFHPESICTSQGAAQKLFSNWWAQIQSWNPCRLKPRVTDLSMAMAIIDPLKPTNPYGSNHILSVANRLNFELRKTFGSFTPQMSYTRLALASLSVIDICESLSITRDELILLDSQGHASGRYSILGLINHESTLKLTYNVCEKTLRYGFGSDLSGYRVSTVDSIDDVWLLLRETLNVFKIGKGQQLPVESPFWGGFMGYITYEAGLDTMRVQLHESDNSSKTPDVHQVFVLRSIVLDHMTGTVYIQTLIPDESDWLRGVRNKLELLQECKLRVPNQWISKDEGSQLDEDLRKSKVIKPDETTYSKKISLCQDNLAAGKSYELCLTDETKIITAPGIDSWELYKKLRQRNPAPFGGFLHLNDVTIVGSSPERFLQWSRQGHVEFRPIKGTVKKSSQVTEQQAYAILRSSKEQAENLMIVDLIRHDLTGVVGSLNCWVSELLVIEEYHSIYQLVSAIQGRLPYKTQGIDVLRASLPPGSMTGAPKRRSCEILRNLETRTRGIYSGVLGYMDIGGGADFSVVIRTAFKESRNGYWRVGAGGAITIQSNVQDEFMEMQAKASSVLDALLREAAL